MQSSQPDPSAQQAQHQSTYCSLFFQLKSLDGTRKSKLKTFLDFRIRPKSIDVDGRESKQAMPNINPIDLLPILTSSLKGFISKGEKEIVQAKNKQFFQAVQKQNGQKQGGLREIKRPLPVLTYCQICQEKFDDYLLHISHPSHDKMARQSKGTRMISELLFNCEWLVKRTHPQRNRNKGISAAQKEWQQIMSPSKKKISESGQIIRAPVLAKAKTCKIETAKSLVNLKFHKQQTVSNTPLLNL